MSRLFLLIVIVVVVVIVFMAMFVFVFLMSMLVDHYDRNWHRDSHRMGVRQPGPMVAMAGVHDTGAQGEYGDGSAYGKLND